MCCKVATLTCASYQRMKICCSRPLQHHLWQRIYMCWYRPHKHLFWLMATHICVAKGVFLLWAVLYMVHIYCQHLLFFDIKEERRKSTRRIITKCVLGLWLSDWTHRALPEQVLLFLKRPCSPFIQIHLTPFQNWQLASRFLHLLLMDSPFCGSGGADESIHKFRPHEMLQAVSTRIGESLLQSSASGASHRRWGHGAAHHKPSYAALAQHAARWIVPRLLQPLLQWGGHQRQDCESNFVSLQSQSIL
jgi:hypothetical protein